MARTTQTAIALGRVQRAQWEALQAGHCHSPEYALQGKAKRYGDLYTRSFHRMLRRAERAGYTILRTPGPRGGEWGAIYAVAPKDSYNAN